MHWLHNLVCDQKLGSPWRFLYRGPQLMKDLDGVLVGVVVKNHAQEINFGIFDWLCGEEVVGEE